MKDFKLEGDREALQTQHRFLCLLAASPNSQNSTEFAAALVQVLTEASPGFTVAEAIAKLQQQLRNSNSPFLTWLSGAASELLLPAGEKGTVFDSGICPYMGLQAFGKKDAFYFHGRDFGATASYFFSGLALVGASGSGKSSVVRALPLLETGKLLSQKCATVYLRPGREPIQPQAVAQGKAKEVEGLLHLRVESLAWRLRQREEGMSVLVVDQFEELVRGSHILVAPSLTETEYREAIVEPTRKVGAAVEVGLVKVLLAEVREAGLPLPLLQFALRQLWEVWFCP